MWEVRVKVGLNFMGAESLFGGTLGPVLETVAKADAIGVDLISTCDHLGFNAAVHAERRRTHGFPYGLEQPWIEPISFLSAVAAVTTRARLSCFVLVAPLRPPLLLAKQLATLDVLSGGRVTMCLGVGWQKAEFDANNIPFEGRFGYLEELVSACRALWGSAPASFPVQGAKLPLLLGFAPTDRNFERIARVADGWAVNPAGIGEFAERTAALKRIVAAHGRDPDALEIEIQFAPPRKADGAIDYTASIAAAKTWAKAGATTISPLLISFCREAGEIDGFLNWVAILKGELG
jgi:alkanesulfonate monooxygenase SsuD/methylene tetrahydromethanopterin reductase-like flavin-dependent oxidoreductase (luciferase family)